MGCVQGKKKSYFSILLFFFFGFYPGLVQHLFVGLPLRSWWTIGAPSVQGAIPMSIFSFFLPGGCGGV